MDATERNEPADELTQLLRRVVEKDRSAEEALLALVYPRLRAIAAKALGRQRATHSLQPTALVHEVYLRLLGRGTMDWQNRAHFFAVAARCMRNILVDHARHNNAARSGGGVRPIPLDEKFVYSPQDDEMVLRLHEALDRLAVIDARQVSIVEMRFFGGLTEEEIALILGLSSRTVKRDWAAAQAWLRAEMAAG